MDAGINDKGYSHDGSSITVGKAGDSGKGNIREVVRSRSESASDYEDDDN